MLYLNAYDRKARLAPGLLAGLPVATVVTSLGLRQNPVLAWLIGIAAAAGLPVLLASFVRIKGLAIQAQLFTVWGGPPTTIALRFHSTAATQERRDRWRAAVTAATGIDLLMPDEEAADPLRADARIETAVAELRELTRDRKSFPLVFEENRNYGFARNLLALRRIGLTLAGACAVGLAAFAVAFRTDRSPSALVAGVVVCLVLTGIWTLVPTNDFVRAHADRYAERLLDSATTVRRAAANGAD